MTIQSHYQDRPFKPKIYQGKRKWKAGSVHYDRSKHEGKYRSNSKDRFSRSAYWSRPQYGQMLEKKTWEENISEQDIISE